MLRKKQIFPARLIASNLQELIWPNRMTASACAGSVEVPDGMKTRIQKCNPFHYLRIASARGPNARAPRQKVFKRVKVFKWDRRPFAWQVYVFWNNTVSWLDAYCSADGMLWEVSILFFFLTFFLLLSVSRRICSDIAVDVYFSRVVVLTFRNSTSGVVSNLDVSYQQCPTPFNNFLEWPGKLSLA